MKYLYKSEDLCIQCHKCEEVCALKVFKLKSGAVPAIHIIDNPAPNGEKINVCDQCGECMPACAELALTRLKNGVVMLDKKKCVGCLVCVGFCSKSAMRMNNDDLEPYKCIACGQCAEVCPTGAIEIREKEEEGQACLTI